MTTNPRDEFNDWFSTLLLASKDSFLRDVLRISKEDLWRHFEIEWDIMQEESIDD